MLCQIGPLRVPQICIDRPPVNVWHSGDAQGSEGGRGLGGCDLLAVVLWGMYAGLTDGEGIRHGDCQERVPPYQGGRVMINMVSSACL